MKPSWTNKRQCARCREHLAPYCYRVVAHTRCRGYVALAAVCRRCEGTVGVDDKPTLLSKAQVRDLKQGLLPFGDLQGLDPHTL